VTPDVEEASHVYNSGQDQLVNHDNLAVNYVENCSCNRKSCVEKRSTIKSVTKGGKGGTIPQALIH